MALYHPNLNIKSTYVYYKREGRYLLSISRTSPQAEYFKRREGPLWCPISEQVSAPFYAPLGPRLLQGVRLARLRCTPQNMKSLVCHCTECNPIRSGKLWLAIRVWSLKSRSEWRFSELRRKDDEYY